MTKKTVNAVIQHDPSPAYAQGLIEQLILDGATISSIASRCGVTTRTILRAKSHGISKFPLQVTLEIMAGSR